MIKHYLGVSECDAHHSIRLSSPHRPVLVAFNPRPLLQSGQHHDDHHGHYQYDQHSKHYQHYQHYHHDQHNNRPGEHDDGGRPLFPNHPPKVGKCLRERALSVISNILIELN